MRKRRSECYLFINYRSMKELEKDKQKEFVSLKKKLESLKDK